MCLTSGISTRLNGNACFLSAECLLMFTEIKLRPKDSARPPLHAWYCYLSYVWTGWNECYAGIVLKYINTIFLKRFYLRLFNRGTGKEIYVVTLKLQYSAFLNLRHYD